MKKIENWWSRESFFIFSVMTMFDKYCLKGINRGIGILSAAHSLQFTISRQPHLLLTGAERGRWVLRSQVRRVVRGSKEQNDRTRAVRCRGVAAACIYSTFPPWHKQLSVIRPKFLLSWQPGPRPWMRQLSDMQFYLRIFLFAYSSFKLQKSYF